MIFQVTYGVGWGANRGGRGECEEGEEEEAGERRGTFQVPGELLFRIPEHTEAHLRVAFEVRDDGDHRDDGDDEGGEGDDKGEGGDKEGEMGGDKGVEKERDAGGQKGVAGSKDAPRQPPTTQEG